jgi:hypothetical protein
MMASSDDLACAISTAIRGFDGEEYESLAVEDFDGHPGQAWDDRRSDFDDHGEGTGWLETADEGMPQSVRMGHAIDDGEFSDGGSDVDISQLGGIRDQDLEDEGAADAFDKGDDWILGGNNITVSPFVQETGPSVNLADNAGVLDFFFLFFGEEFFESITIETNRYASDARRKALASGNPHRTDWTPTTVPEMRAFIAMQIMFGVMPVTDMNLIWSTISWAGPSYPWYSSIMPRNRYWALSRYFHVRDTSDAPSHGSPNFDPLFKIRPVIDLFNRKVPSCTSLGNISVLMRLSFLMMAGTLPNSTCLVNRTR